MTRQQRFMKHFWLFCMIACSLVIAGELQLFVIFPDGSKRAVDIDNSAKVIDLARQIVSDCQQQGQFLDVSAEHAIITFQGQPLNHHDDLSETGVSQEASVQFQLPTPIPIKVNVLGPTSLIGEPIVRPIEFEVDVSVGIADLLQRIIAGYGKLTSSADDYNSFLVEFERETDGHDVPDLLEKASLPCDIDVEWGNGENELRMDFEHPCVELVPQQWLLEHTEHRYHREIQANQNVLEKVGEFEDVYGGAANIYQVRENGIIEWRQLYNNWCDNSCDGFQVLHDALPSDVDRSRMKRLLVQLPPEYTLIFSGVHSSNVTTRSDE